MTDVEVLRTGRMLAAQGQSPRACSVGDWPGAASLFHKANWWHPAYWLPFGTRGMLVRAFDRAISLGQRVG
jgi:hypothetical protein